MRVGEFPVKGLILAAGLGTRLLPITKHLPKPLLPFFGPSLFDLALETMHQHGVTDVSANSHHLAAKIQAELKRGYKNLRLNSSFEAQILGTGGAIPPLRSWLNGSHLLIFNADILCDVNLQELIKHHFASEALATMVCLKNGAGDKTPIYHDRLHVKGIGKVAANYLKSELDTTSFSGIHILTPTFMDQIPGGKPHHIIDTYLDLLNKGLPVNIFLHDGLWSDLGTPQDYFGALCRVRKEYDQLPNFTSIYQGALDSEKLIPLKSKKYYSKLEDACWLGEETFWFNQEAPPHQLPSFDHSVILDQADLHRLTMYSHKIVGYGEMISLDES